MHPIYDPQSLHSESDVEQKIILPLLTNLHPFGLSLPIANIYTKVNIRGLTIGKGNSKKIYYPDFAFVHAGIPIMVVEAKNIKEDAYEGLREARLYAAEINATFDENIDPVKYVVSCNGRRILAGYSNVSQPKFDIESEQFSSADAQFSEFINLFSVSNLSKWGDSVVSEIRPNRYWKPRKLVGGISAQSEEIGLNSFGTTIKSDFRGIFDPATIEERNVIAQECYIGSKRRERYVDSIDRTFQAIIPPSEKNTQSIEDTSKPIQIISKLRQGQHLTNQVMLLIGAAGSGKSTFVDHLRVKALPADVRKSTRWIHVNMNAAPVSREEIYAWLRKEIQKGAKAQARDLDFDDIDVIRKIFRSDVERFRKGIGRLFEANKEKYNEKLAEHLQSIFLDDHYVAQSYCKYLSSVGSALIIIVLDNCDKRLMEEQLLMFEAAQWLRVEFNAMVFLPLREETYDNNLSVPPLDTALKDLAFRIEAPRFDLILRSRVDFAIRKLQEDPSRKFSYDLPNSMRATYTAADKISYLSSILRSVFESNENVRRLLIGLSGRNMRRAMEIFLEFCSSGHISEDYILKMVQSKGAYSLPYDIVSRVILRSKKRYYDSDYSYVVNVLSADIHDKKPNFFLRVAILRYLANVSHDGKGSRIAGYVRGSDILGELRKIGADEGLLLREIDYLAKSHCIVSEDFRTTGLTLDDLVTIGPAGRTHLFMLGNIHYIAAVSEDTWFRDEPLAKSIAERIRNPSVQFSNRSTLFNAKAAARFFDTEFNRVAADLDRIFVESDTQELISMSSLLRAVSEREGAMAGAWNGVEERYPVGQIAVGKVVREKPFGFFVEFEPGISGLLHTSKLGGLISRPSVGDTISCTVLKVDIFDRKIELEAVC